MPALSSEDSLASSHRSGLGSRKPAGGGPEGVACRRDVVENAAARPVVACPSGRRAADSVAAGRLRATSIVKGFADAIVLWPVAELGGWSVVVVIEGALDPRLAKAQMDGCALDINRFALIGGRSLQRDSSNSARYSCIWYETGIIRYKILDTT